MSVERPTILVVDDEPALCELVRRYLSVEGYECCTALSGEEALGMLQCRQFDMVVTDIMMPGMSGIDLLTIVKTLYPEVAVLVVTAVEDERTSSQAVELGAYGYVVKPFSKSQLLVNAAAALARRRLYLAGREEASDAPLMVPQKAGERRKVLIRANDLVKLVREGADEVALMESFRLSSQQLHSLLEQLVSAGKLDPDEVASRGSLRAGSVAIEMDSLKMGEIQAVKPVINASDALQCIRSGISDASIMKRYNISARGLQSLIRKLVDAGLLSESDLEARLRSQEKTVVLE
jgi:DNA-binding response OmpR family regulator